MSHDSIAADYVSSGYFWEKRIAMTGGGAVVAFQECYVLGHRRNTYSREISELFY